MALDALQMSETGHQVPYPAVPVLPEMPTLPGLPRRPARSPGIPLPVVPPVPRPDGYRWRYEGDVTGAATPVRGVGEVGTPRLSPGLARLLNAALMDRDFGTLFVQAPLRAAQFAAGNPAEAFGCRLPDPALCLPALGLAAAEWDVLERLSPSISVSEAAASLIALGAQPIAEGASRIVDEALPPRESEAA